MGNRTRLRLGSFIFMGLIGMLIQWGAAGYGSEQTVMIIELEGVINPANATFLSRGLEQADPQGLAGCERGRHQRRDRAVPGLRHVPGRGGGLPAG